MDINMCITFGVLVFAVIFFVWGKVRSDIVALGVLLALMLTNILTVEEALSGFSNNIVIMMAGLFVIGGGIFQTGLAKMISTKILKLAGTSEKTLFILVMLVTVLISSFVSNTGTVALMLPIVISLAATAQINVKKLLMPLAFASSMGITTLISTPPNLIISGTLEENGYEPLAFFSFLPVALIAFALGIFLLLPMSKLLVSKKDKEKKSKKTGEEKLTELSQKYQIAQNLYRVKVNAGSDLINKTLKDLDITARFNVTVAKIQRDVQKRFFKSVDTKVAGADSRVHEQDLLYILGSFENIKAFASANNLSLVNACHLESKALSVSETGGMDFSATGIAELVLMSNAKLINKTVKETDFRNLYNLNILGIRRNDEYILQDLKDQKMKAGDVLLIQGKWNDIHKLDQEDNAEWVIVGEPLKESEKIPLTPKAPIAGIIMIAMVVVMVFGWLPPVTAVIIAAILMVLTGCLRSVVSAYQAINWETIVLFAGMIPLAIAMNKTGASDLISGGIVSNLGQYGPIGVLAGIYLATSFLTMFLSNTATAILFAPIAFQAAIELNVNPVTFLFAVAVGASMCFASPFATPPNALVMSAGGYKFSDYIKVGLPLQIIFAIVMIFALPLLFPL